MTAVRRLGLRQAADARAVELGFAGIEDMLEAAYEEEKTWVAVAAELGECCCSKDSVAGWARSMGLTRGVGWYQAHVIGTRTDANDDDGVPLRLTPDEEAEWTARHVHAWLEGQL